MKKYRHGKLVGGLTMGLVAVSLVTVGFSAWVIAAENQSGTVDNISVSVADVQDKRVLLTNAKIGLDNAVLFDGVQDSKGQITCDSNLEDLTFGITFDLEVFDKASFKGIDIAATEDGTLAGFVENNYINSPFVFKTQGSEQYVPLVDGDWLTVASHTVYYNNLGAATEVETLTNATALVDVKNPSTNKYTISVTFTFKWGSAFDNQNPVKEANGAQIEALKAIMGTNAKFKLTLRSQPGEAKIEIPNA